MEDVPNMSYFLFKPDAEKKFGEMREYIENKFPKVRYFAVTNWSDTIKKLYYKHYETKGEKFSDMFEPFLASVNELYGNYAIIAVVKDDDIPKEELVKRVFETKQTLRNKYSKPESLGIISNTASMPEVKQHRRILNKVEVTDFEGKRKKTKYMNGPGEYRIHFLNYIHSPDDSTEENDKEMLILAENNLLSAKNLMTKEQIDFVSKYKTFEIVGEYAKTKQVAEGPELD